MSTSFQADNPLPPRSGFVIVLDSTTVAASTTVPTTWLGCFVGVVAAAATRILFASTSGVTITSGVGSSAGVAVPVPAEQPQFYRLDGDDTWIHHLGSTTTTIAMWKASP